MIVPSPLAAAGIQDCVDADMDCMPGFGWFLATLGAVIVGGTVHLAVATWATADILDAQVGTARRILFVIVVWALPFAGAVAWVFCRNRATANRGEA